MRKYTVLSRDTDVFAQIEAVNREIAPIEAAFRENGGERVEMCRVCAHWNARKGKCAVFGTGYGEISGKCGLFVPDPAKNGGRP